MRPRGITGIYAARAQHIRMVTETLLKKIHSSIAQGLLNVSVHLMNYEVPILMDNSSKISRSVRNVPFLSSYSVCRRHGWI